MKILLASHNKNKVREIEALLPKEFSGNVLTLSDIGYDKEIIEDEDSFEGNAYIKARTAALLGYIGIGDDSGLCVDALGGRPGVYSARFSGEGATDKKNNEKLLSEMKDIPEGKRGAYFVSVVACVFPDGREFSTRGECNGRILFEEKGNGGFGYDPLFFYPPFNKTYAENDG